MPISRRFFLTVSGGLFAGTGFARDERQPDQAAEAKDILERMASIYARCSSYADSGRVVTRFKNASRADQVEEVPFATAFVRPDRFRFEFSTTFSGVPSMPSQRFIAHAEGGKVQSWWDVQPGVKQAASLDLVLAGATGISGGAAHTVPRLLLPDSISGRRPIPLIELRRLEDARLGESDCIRIQGTWPGLNDPAAQEEFRQEVLKATGNNPGTSTTGPETLWIDRSSFLLRRVDRSSQIGEVRNEATTTYEPTLDAAIADVRLAFDPPAG